jgi:hypothetical protein
MKGFPHTARRLLIRLVRIGLCALIAVVAFAGCREQQVNLPLATPEGSLDLPFDTIARSERGDGNNRYRTVGPRLFVVSSAAELAALDGAVAPRTWAQLQQVDWQRYLVMAVFEGKQGSITRPKSGIEIRRISLRGETVVVYATIHKGAPGTVKLMMETAPYHIVQVRRGPWAQGQVEYLLDVDGVVSNPKTPPQPTPDATNPPWRRTVPLRTPSKAPTKPTSGIIPGRSVAGVPLPIRYGWNPLQREQKFTVNISNPGCGLELAPRPEEGLRTL